MKHARSDYDRIQDPAVEDPSLLSSGSTPIGEDEPVFVLRARDKFFVPILQEYLHFLRLNSAPFAMKRAVSKHIELAEEWQRNHGCKMPDMPLETANDNPA